MSMNNNTFNDQESNQDKYLNELRQVLKEKSIGIGINLEDEFLMKFLRSQDYSVKNACDRIKGYIYSFEKYPELFKNVDLSLKAIENGLCCLCTETNATSGESILYFNFGQWDPRNVTFAELVSPIGTVQEYMALNEESQRNGFLVVIEMGNFGWKQISKLGVSEIRTAIHLFFGAFPINVQKMIIVHENSFTNLLFKIAKPFLSEEMRNRIIFVGSDMDKVHSMVSSDLLPAKLGGTAKDFDCESFSRLIKSNEQVILKQWQPFNKAFD